MRAKRQLAHDLRDVRHVRKVARPRLFDVPLQLLLDGDGRVLGHRFEQLPRPPVGRRGAQLRQLEQQRVLVEAVLLPKKEGAGGGTREEERRGKRRRRGEASTTTDGRRAGSGAAARAHLSVEAGEAKEEVLLPRAGDAREEGREELEGILGAMHLDEEGDS